MPLFLLLSPEAPTPYQDPTEEREHSFVQPPIVLWRGYKYFLSLSYGFIIAHHLTFIRLNLIDRHNLLIHQHIAIEHWKQLILNLELAISHRHTNLLYWEQLAGVSGVEVDFEDLVFGKKAVCHLFYRYFFGFGEIGFLGLGYGEGGRLGWGWEDYSFFFEYFDMHLKELHIRFILITNKMLMKIQILHKYIRLYTSLLIP